MNLSSRQSFDKIRNLFRVKYWFKKGVASTFAEKTRDEWAALLLENEVPHSPAYDSDEALEDPQAKHLQLKVSAPSTELGTFTTVRAPYNFDGAPELDIRPPPVLDEHGAEIRQELERNKSS